MVRAFRKAASASSYRPRPAKRMALALPGGHIIRPRGQCRLEQRECDPRTRRAVAAQGHATVSLDLGSLMGIHPLAVENDQVGVCRGRFSRAWP